MKAITLDDGSIRRLAQVLAPMVADIVMQQQKRHLTSKEKAKQLGITEGTLRQWVYKGKINAIKDGDSKQARLLFEE